MLTSKELTELINKLDVMLVAVHQVDVAHIDLIGYPKDIFALEEHVLETNALRRKVEDETIRYRDGITHITPTTTAIQLPRTRKTL